MFYSRNRDKFMIAAASCYLVCIIAIVAKAYTILIFLASFKSTFSFSLFQNGYFSFINLYICTNWKIKNCGFWKKMLFLLNIHEKKNRKNLDKKDENMHVTNRIFAVWQRLCIRNVCKSAVYSVNNRYSIETPFKAKTRHFFVFKF